MTVNPLQIIKFKDKLNDFRNRHPGVGRFISAVSRKGLQEGSVLELKITEPDGNTMVTNFRVTEADIDLLRMISALRE